jgi:hypothetical protein
MASAQINAWVLTLPGLRANSALLTDAYASPLRAQRGAAKRER